MESFGGGCITLPLFDSTDAAFFLLSVTSAPAMVVTTVEGGMCRRPGPSFNVFRFPVPVGSAWDGISSPGSTSVAIVAICVRKLDVLGTFGQLRAMVVLLS
jgi:hypothetical protein